MNAAESPVISGTADALIRYLQTHRGERFSLRLEPTVDAENAAAIQYLQQRLRQALTDPDEILQAEADLAELHQRLGLPKDAAPLE